MKKNKLIWNYLDMFITIFIMLAIILICYFVAENLEKYIYRYTIFPFIAMVLIFTLGVFLGRSIERTRKNKPIGLISKKMSELRKRKNVFIFSDNGQTYIPRKEIIEDIKSGEIVHIKQFNQNDFEIEEFEDMYNINMEELVDSEMRKQNEDDEGIDIWKL